MDREILQAEEVAWEDRLAGRWDRQTSREKVEKAGLDWISPRDEEKQKKLGSLNPRLQHARSAPPPQPASQLTSPVCVLLRGIREEQQQADCGTPPWAVVVRPRREEEMQLGPMVLTPHRKNGAAVKRASEGNKRQG
ncbi:hypothetical protein Dda_6377 [Drechslerella dactyloides]|uniref:Uncharacterized protein n=1 Tax=Drechslerella dactyloides TaxID=74499 RepID=A0AAD6NHG9_DREDA|nr:hypothetical protein Dda_6377 [Drechslerella dactyloides]